MASFERLTAAERRESILEAAAAEIALRGFAGATTAAVAKRAGISHAHLFRFYPSKTALAVAVIDRSALRILASWHAAVPEPDESRLDTLGRAYTDALSERRTELMVILQAFAASADSEIAAALRGQLAYVYRYLVDVLERDGQERAREEATGFLSLGFLINAAMAVGLESELSAEEWAGICGRNGVARIEDRFAEAVA